MKCPVCGKQIKDGSTRCFQCGTWFKNLDPNRVERPMIEEKESFFNRLGREWQVFSSMSPFNFSGLRTVFFVILGTIVVLLLLFAVLKFTGL